jgi:arginase family enzyme
MNIRIIQVPYMSADIKIFDIEAALVSLQDRVTGIYLHIDMDAFEISEGRANHYRGEVVK